MDFAKQKTEGVNKRIQLQAQTNSLRVYDSAPSGGSFNSNPRFRRKLMVTFAKLFKIDFAPDKTINIFTYARKIFTNLVVGYADNR